MFILTVFELRAAFQKYQQYIIGIFNFNKEERANINSFLRYSKYLPKFRRNLLQDAADQRDIFRPKLFY